MAAPQDNLDQQILDLYTQGQTNTQIAKVLRKADMLDPHQDATPWRYDGQPYATYAEALAAKRAAWAQRGCHPHTCPDCSEDWACADADCEPEEQEKCCDPCFRAYLGDLL